MEVRSLISRSSMVWNLDFISKTGNILHGTRPAGSRRLRFQYPLYTWPITPLNSGVGSESHSPESVPLEDFLSEGM